MLRSMTQFTQNTVCDYNMECVWELCTLLHVLLVLLKSRIVLNVHFTRCSVYILPY